MQFAIIAHDGKGMHEKRLAVRQRHLENIAQIKGKVICAGGILDEEGKNGRICHDPRFRIKRSTGRVSEI